MTSYREKLTQCASQKDGDCDHGLCPQLLDNEPLRSGRSCPLYDWDHDEEGVAFTPLSGKVTPFTLTSEPSSVGLLGQCDILGCSAVATRIVSGVLTNVHRCEAHWANWTRIV